MDGCGTLSQLPEARKLRSLMVPLDIRPLDTKSRRGGLLLKTKVVSITGFPD
ncbi:MAG: hypothetical protein QXO30_06405 [Candidatus Caldarchaeum sp.]